MLARAVDGHVPAGWVTADEVYGGDARLRAWLEQQNLAYVLAVKTTQPRWAHGEHGPAEIPACALVARLPARAWRRLSAGDGAKGPRGYDWARVALVRPGWPGRGFWLLVRRRLTDGELAFSACFGPAPTTLAELVRVAGSRWAVEECFQAAKDQVGLDHDQVRRYDAWYRHVTLVLVAQALLAVVRAQAGGGAAGRAELPQPPGSDLIRVSTAGAAASSGWPAWPRRSSVEPCSPAASSAQILSQVPSRCQRRRRLWQVCHGPYRVGTSRHGRPVWSFQRMPPRTWR
jgi:hypothetical protein